MAPERATINALNGHLRNRPHGWCRECGDPRWPCLSAQARLLTWFARRQDLMAYLNEQLAYACSDMPSAEAGELFRQFVGWALTAPPPGAATMPDQTTVLLPQIPDRRIGGRHGF